VFRIWTPKVFYNYTRYLKVMDPNKKKKRNFGGGEKGGGGGTRAGLSILNLMY
jgi:hypothetical protein